MHRKGKGERMRCRRQEFKDRRSLESGSRALMPLKQYHKGMKKLMRLLGNAKGREVIRVYV